MFHPIKLSQWHTVMDQTTCHVQSLKGNKFQTCTFDLLTNFWISAQHPFYNWSDGAAEKLASWKLLFEKNGLNGQLKLPSLFLGKVTISPVNELCEAIIIQITSMVVLHDIETCNQISFYLSDSLTLKICVRQQSQHRFSLWCFSFVSA